MENNLDKKHNIEPSQKIIEERLMKLFALMEKSSEWKMNYEYFQRASDVTENSIRVSET